MRRMIAWLLRATPEPVPEDDERRSPDYCWTHDTIETEDDR